MTDNRTPRQVIDSILANLEMARKAAHIQEWKAKTEIGDELMECDYHARGRAFQEAITLIQTETKDMQ